MLGVAQKNIACLWISVLLACLLKKIHTMNISLIALNKQQNAQVYTLFIKYF